MEAKQATLHHELIAQLLDSRIPKTEREHAAAREIERLRADLLQELVEAPAPEPVARVTGYYGGYLSIATVDGRVLSAGTALYLAPPAPKLSDERILEIYEEAKANWNAQADQCNQWSDLGVDEVVTLVARAVEREILGGAQS